MCAACSVSMLQIASNCVIASLRHCVIASLRLQGIHKAARGLDSKYRLGLSGTPVSKLREVASLCAALMPDEPALHDYETWRSMTPRELDEFRRRFILRRVSEPIKLPPLHETVERIAIESEEYPAYKAAWDICVVRYERMVKVSESANVPPIMIRRIRDAYIQSVSRLRGIAAHHRLTDLVLICKGALCSHEECSRVARFGNQDSLPERCTKQKLEADVKSSKDLIRATKATSLSDIKLSAKEHVAFGIINDAVSAGEKIIVFCGYTSILQHLQVITSRS